MYFSLISKNAVWFRISGACGIPTPMFAFTRVLFAVFLSPQFSWTNMALSDLVVVGGAPSVLFNTDLIISGLLTLAFGSGLSKLLQEKPPGEIGVFVFLLDALALIAIGDFPENVKPMHYYASVAFFALIPLSMLLITGAFVLMGKVKRGFLTLLVAIFAVSVWVVHFRCGHFTSCHSGNVSAFAASTCSVMLGFRMLKAASGVTGRQQDRSVCETVES